MEKTIVPMDEHFDAVIHHGDTNHMAVLVHKGDHDCCRPLASMQLDPYTNMTDGTEHRIFRSNTPQDGLDSQFENTIRDWADKTYPAMVDRVYRKAT